jgi:tetratricopeptide (TPR) repeat protein
VISARSRRRPARSFGLLALALGSFVTRAVAQVPEPEHAYLLSAQHLAEEGMRAYAALRYEEAAERLRRSYAVIPDPSVGFALGQALEQLGRLLDARAQYERVAQTAEGEGKPWNDQLAAHRAASKLRSLSERIPSLRILVRGTTTEQIEIRVDDDPISPVPEKLALDPGKHVVTVSKEERVISRTVELHESAEEIAVFDLSPPAHRVVPSAPASSSIWRGITLGAGGVMLGAAVTAAMLSLQERKALDRACSPDHRCPNAYSNEVDRYQTLRALAIAGFAAGVACTGVGVGLWLAGPHASQERAPDHKLEARVGLGELRFFGTF